MIYGFDKKWALPFSPKQFHISTTRNFYNQYTVFIFILKAYIFYSDIPSIAYPLVSIQRAGKDPAGRVERSARENQEKKKKRKKVEALAHVLRKWQVAVATWLSVAARWRTGHFPAGLGGVESGWGEKGGRGSAVVDFYALGIFLGCGDGR